MKEFFKSINEIKFLCIKIFLLFLFIFSVYFVENSFVRNSLMPIYKHITVLKKIDKTYIRLEQFPTTDKDSIIIESPALQLHKEIHETEDLVFKCQQLKNTNCYKSAISINADSDNSFLNKCLLEGELPKNEKFIAIDENLAKTMNYSVGDELCLKSALLYETVNVSGIIRNFYGFPDFKEESRFYLIQNRGKKYNDSVISSYYTFSDSDKNAQSYKDVSREINSQWKKIIKPSALFFIGLIILNVVSFFSYRKIFSLKSYYRRLFSLGKSKSYILSKKIADNIFFAFICLLLIFISSLFGGGVIVILFNIVALAIARIINLFF